MLQTSHLPHAWSQMAPVKADPKAQLPSLPIHTSIPLAPYAALPPVAPAETGTAGRHPSKHRLSICQEPKQLPSFAHFLPEDLRDSCLLKITNTSNWVCCRARGGEELKLCAGTLSTQGPGSGVLSESPKDTHGQCTASHRDVLHWHLCASNLTPLSPPRGREEPRKSPSKCPPPR